MSNRADLNFSIQLNGESYAVEGDARLSGLIEKLNLRRGRIAIELNQAVIPKAEWANILLRPGDQVEIVNFVGGG
jgi:sulfur carrier protein